MKITFSAICLVAALAISNSPAWTQDGRQVLLRVDDIGMCHAVNMALLEVAETGMPVSASVMFACPWYQEAVGVLKQHPQITVGVHLTLNSEWRNYKWGPVAGRDRVPSLVDEHGYFVPSHGAFVEKNAVLAEVEIELRAQIERALATGLDIKYVDAHMHTAWSTPELRTLTEKLAAEYKLGISGYFGEAYQSLFEAPVAEKSSALLGILANAPSAKPTLVVIHIGQDSAELSALFDMNNPIMNTTSGEPLMSKHRQAELSLLLSDAFRAAVKKDDIRLVNYGDLIAEKQLASMARPAD